MSTTGYTPGPWVLSENGAQIVAPNATDRHGITPVEVVDLTGAMSGDDCGADARLIAAAPELLAACAELYQILLNGMQDDYDEMTAALGRARAAIAKAEGRAATPRAEG